MNGALSFDRVLGQEHAKELLAATISRDRISHAWLFSGSDGVGKTLLAAEFAKALLCRAPGAPHGNDCAECRMIAHNNHPDLMLLQAPEGKRLIPIEQTRLMSQSLSLRPVQSPHRAVIIREADCMREEAANALLKTLEEPPPYAILILTTHRPRNLLDTIRSRCQELRFAPLTPEHIRAILAQHTEFPEREKDSAKENTNHIQPPEFSPEETDIASRLAEGSAGKAIRSIESGCIEFYQNLLGRLLAIPAEAPFVFADDILTWLKSHGGNLEQQRELLRELLRLLTCAWRDILHLCNRAADVNLFNAHCAEPLHTAAERTTPIRAERIIETIWNARRQTDQNASIPLVLETLFTSIATLQSVNIA